MKKRLCVIELYKEYFKNNTSLIDILSDHYTVQTFAFFDVQTEYFSSKLKHIYLEFVCFIKAIYKFRSSKILCFGGHYSFFLINRVFGFLLGKDFHLYIYNFYLHAMGEKTIVKRILRYFLNSKKITLIVQSPVEVEYYSNLSKKCKVIFLPYCEDINNSAKDFIFEKQYIFTGGYTNRDYSLIIKCAKEFQLLHFFIIASPLNQDIPVDLPENITLYRDTDKILFNSIMQNASAVIIPLKNNVGASGQMLCLGAMSMKKPIIYTDISSINYYFQPYINGIPYKIGDLNSIKAALTQLINRKKEEQEKMGENAYEYYINNFTKKFQNQKLYNILSNEDFLSNSTNS